MPGRGRCHARWARIDPADFPDVVAVRRGRDHADDAPVRFRRPQRAALAGVVRGERPQFRHLAIHVQHDAGIFGPAGADQRDEAVRVARRGRRRISAALRRSLAMRRQPSASDASSVAVLTRRYGLMPYAAPCTVATCASSSSAMQTSSSVVSSAPARGGLADAAGDVGKHVERAFRLVAVDAAAGVQHLHRHVAPVAIGDDLLGHAVLRPVQRRRRGRLADGGDAGRRLALHVHHRADQVLRPAGEADAPAGHRIGLRRAADRHASGRAVPAPPARSCACSNPSNTRCSYMSSDMIQTCGCFTHHIGDRAQFRGRAARRRSDCSGCSGSATWSSA